VIFVDQGNKTPEAGRAEILSENTLCAGKLILIF